MGRDSRMWLPWVLLVLALAFLILSGSGLLAPIEDLLSYVVSPVEQVFARIFKSLSGTGQSTRDIQTLQQQIQDLQTAYESLIQENFRLREYQAENEELRRQLNFAQQNPTYRLIGADVIERGCTDFPCGDAVGLDTNPYLRYVIINTGSRDGVAVGMPVITGGAALVGRIARSSSNLSYVQLVNDPQSQLAVMSQQTRVLGVVESTNEGVLYMTHILPDESISEGETIITAAIGGLLPRGLIIGQVESVSYLESELFQRAKVRAAIDFRHLETVLVVTEFTIPDIDELKSP
ncbi:MAG: rod shape-determining protein MreC [Anaerolineae bacterium]|nr:rod shape-determining protein MreC [Anaerolineae bacterium]